MHATPLTLGYDDLLEHLGQGGDGTEREHPVAEDRATARYPGGSGRQDGRRNDASDRQAPR